MLPHQHDRPCNTLQESEAIPWFGNTNQSVSAGRIAPPVKQKCLSSVYFHVFYSNVLHKCHVNDSFTSVAQMSRQHIYFMRGGLTLGWGPLYYTQVIRCRKVAPHESKTRIYFRLLTPCSNQCTIANVLYKCHTDGKNDKIHQTFFTYISIGCTILRKNLCFLCYRS